MIKVKVMSACLLLLIVLLAAMIFRYDRLEAGDRVSKYIDRWTGIEWVKVKHALGEDRLLAAYYQNADAAVIPEEDIAADLVRIANTENTLMVVWWTLLLLCSGGMITVLALPRLLYTRK